MARKKHLINVHTSTGTTAPTGASLYLGEIAVQHTPNDPALWIKVGSAETSTEYEKFIGLTEITNLIQNNNILGSGYTYSGIPYVYSSTTIADAYSALTYELLEDELVTAAGLNDLNERIQGVLTINCNGEQKGRYNPSADTVVNIDIAADNTLGSGYTYSGIPYVNSSTTIADAYSAITNELIRDEIAVSASLNDLNTRARNLSGQVESIESRIAGVLTLNVNGEEKGTYTPSADTEINLDIVTDKTLGSGYTYSGIPEVNSATTIAEAYETMAEIVFENEEVAAAALNDLNNRIQGVLTVNVNGEEKGKYVPSADTQLNLDIVLDKTLGSGYTYSGIPYVNSSTTIADAYSALTNEILKDEEVASAAFNDLNDKVRSVSGQLIDYAEKPLILGETYTYSGLPYVNSSTTIADAYSALTNEFIKDEKVISAAFNDVNDRIQGVLTISVNGTEQGKYIPSANTSIDLNVLENVTGADVLLTGYEISSGYTDEELEVTSADTVNEAFGKLQKQNIDNERVIAEAFNDINDRLGNVSGTVSDLSDEVEQLNDSVEAVDTTVQAISTGLQSLSGAVISNTGITALSAAVETNETNIEVLSAAVVELIVSGSSSDDLEALSAAVIDNEYVTAAALNALNDRINAIDTSGLTETDPVFVASAAYGITQQDIDNWNAGGGGGGGTDTNAITGITMNGGNVTVTNRVAALGTVLTAQTKADWNATSGDAQILNKPTIPTVPTSNTAFTNDAGYITGYTETDPTVSAWAKAATKPTYTASEVGALPTGTTLDNIADGTTRKLSNYATTGTVNTLNNTVTAHTANTSIHVTTAQTAAWDGKQDAIGDLETIRSNAEAGAAKVSNVQSDWNATTGLAVILNKPTIPSAPGTLTTTATTAQSTATNEALTGNISLHKVSKTGSYNDLTNKPTIPTVPAWATASTKPTYTASEVGALPTGTTLDGIADGTTRKLSNYATTGNVSTLSSATQSIQSSAQTAYNNRITGGTITSGATNSITTTNNRVAITAATLPSYSTANNDQVLMIKNGVPQWVTPSTITYSSSAPTGGNNGDIWIQTS